MKFPVVRSDISKKNEEIIAKLTIDAARLTKGHWRHQWCGSRKQQLAVSHRRCTYAAPRQMRAGWWMGKVLLLPHLGFI